MSELPLSDFTGEPSPELRRHAEQLLAQLREEVKNGLDHTSEDQAIPETERTQYMSEFDELCNAVEAIDDRMSEFCVFLHESSIRKILEIIATTRVQRDVLTASEYPRFVLDIEQMKAWLSALSSITEQVQKKLRHINESQGQPSGIPPLPPSGRYIEAVRASCKAARQSAGIIITESAIKRLLFSSSLTSTFPRLKLAHGMLLPLNFPSIVAELNVLALLSILNFASGYRVPLHKATGRGAFDSIRAFVFSLYLSSSGGEEDLLSAKGMQSIEAGRVAELMGVADKVHVERSHPEVPGVMIGELGGPVWEVVEMVTRVMKETGDVLVKGGYPDLGTFVLEALREGEKAKNRAHGNNAEVACDVVLERLVRALPGFRDMSYANGQPVYCFKKVLLTIHAVALRFGSSPNQPVPVFNTATLPIFSDNVIPSLLIHLGVIDLSASIPSLGLARLFPQAGSQEALQALLAPAPPASKSANKTVPKEGPTVTVEQAYVLRAAAIDACELIVQIARQLSGDDLHGPKGEDFRWLKEITLPELDAWIWAVAKDRADYRKLERFVLGNTTCF